MFVLVFDYNNFLVLFVFVVGGKLCSIENFIECFVWDWFVCEFVGCECGLDNIG